MNEEAKVPNKELEAIVENVIKPISNDAALVGMAVDRLAYAIAYGSFSDRNPGLGKMIRCPSCHQRRRQNSVLPCCSAAFIVISKNKKGEDCVLPHEKKRLHPHYNARRNQLHQLAIALRGSEELMMAVQKEMSGLAHRWTPEYLLGEMNAPIVAEKYLIFLQKKESKRVRRQQSRSRAANLPGSRRAYAKSLHAAENFQVRELKRAAAWG